LSKEEYKPYEEKMKKTLTVLHEDFAGLRAGRANPSILDRIMVDYYGVPTPINQMCGISVPEARMLVVQPWDTKVLKDVEKAILMSDIGINPNNDGKALRLIFPPLTGERRDALVKTAKKETENARVAIRAIRRDLVDHLKAMKKKGDLTEDGLEVAEKDAQHLTDKYVAEADKMLEAKEKEIHEV